MESDRAAGRSGAPVPLVTSQNPQKSRVGASWLFLSKEVGLRDLFYLLDRDDSGRVSTKDLPLALFSIGAYLEPTELASFISGLESTQRSGPWLDYGQFRSALEPLYRVSRSEDLTDAFGVLDHGEGVIPLEDLLYTMETVGQPIPRSEMYALLEKTGLADEGSLPLEEFVDLMMSD